MVAALLMPYVARQRRIVGGVVQEGENERVGGSYTPAANRAPFRVDRVADLPIPLSGPATSGNCYPDHDKRLLHPRAMYLRQPRPKKTPWRCCCSALPPNPIHSEFGSRKGSGADADAAANLQNISLSSLPSTSPVCKTICKST